LIYPQAFMGFVGCTFLFLSRVCRFTQIVVCSF